MDHQKRKDKLDLLKRNIAEGIEITLKMGVQGSFRCANCKQEKSAGNVLKRGDDIVCVVCFLQVAERTA